VCTKFYSLFGRVTGCYIKLNLTPLYGEFAGEEELCSAILISASTDRQCSKRSTACWHTHFKVQGLLCSCMGNDFWATCFVCNKAPITAAMMGENITTDTPCNTQCLGDRLTDCLKHQGRHTSTQDTRDEDGLQGADFCHIYSHTLLRALLISNVGMHTICKILLF
jgi:hypothetical protein